MTASHSLNRSGLIPCIQVLSSIPATVILGAALVVLICSRKRLSKNIAHFCDDGLLQGW